MPSHQLQYFSWLHPRCFLLHRNQSQGHSGALGRRRAVLRSPAPCPSSPQASSFFSQGGLFLSGAFPLRTTQAPRCSGILSPLDTSVLVHASQPGFGPWGSRGSVPRGLCWRDPRFRGGAGRRHSMGKDPLLPPGVFIPDHSIHTVSQERKFCYRRIRTRAETSVVLLFFPFVNFPDLPFPEICVPDSVSCMVVGCS